MFVSNNFRLPFLLFVTCLLMLSACKKENIYQTKAKPEIIIKAGDLRLSQNHIHFTKDTVYVLAANIIRNDGEILSLEAGTLVKVNDRISITINPGGTIESAGTNGEPVIFTSSIYKGGVGVGSGASGGEHFWYGIRIYGSAGNPPVNGAVTLRFTRIEFAGGNENYSGLPALLLQNAGNNAILENVQVSYAFETASFGFFGGNCNGRNLISYAGNGSDFILADGYRGMLQNVLAYRHPYFGAVSADRILSGLLITGDSTEPALSNVTVIGPANQKGLNAAYLLTDLVAFDKASVASLIVTEGARFHIRNSIFLGFPKGGFYLASRTSGISLNNGVSDFASSFVQSSDSSRNFYLPADTYPPYTASDFKYFLLQPQFANQVFLKESDFLLTDPFNYDILPNAIPTSGSPVLSGADFNTTFFSDIFFEKVSYRGAAGTDNWMNGWTNFIPLQTNYNN